MSFIKIKDPRKREELIKDLIETRKRIKDNFIARKVGESEYQTGLTKLFKPVTETQKATAKEITEAQKTATEKITQGLLPIKEGLENLTIIPPIEAGEPLPVIKATEEQKTIIGDTAIKYLEKTHGRKSTQADIKPVNLTEGLFKIGETPVKVVKNDLIIEGMEPFKGTKGLWNLLTSKDIPDKKDYKPDDLYNYTTIMYNTNVTRQCFNKDNRRISGNKKMENLIKPFVSAFEKDKISEEIYKHFGIKTNEDEEETDEEDEYEEFTTDDPQPGTSGTGLKILPSDPNALIDRFDLLFSSQKAGHTGVRNEIISILDELKRQGVIKTNEYKKLNSLIKK